MYEIEMKINIILFCWNCSFSFTCNKFQLLAKTIRTNFWMGLENDLSHFNFRYCVNKRKLNKDINWEISKKPAYGILSTNRKSWFHYLPLVILMLAEDKRVSLECQLNIFYMVDIFNVFVVIYWYCHFTVYNRSHTHSVQTDLLSHKSKIEFNIEILWNIKNEMNTRMNKEEKKNGKKSLCSRNLCAVDDDINFSVLIK